MAAAAQVRRQVQLCIGKAGLAVGSLVYVRQGQRENSAFAYDESWLASPPRFNVSADLQLMPGHQTHKAASPHDSVFHGAIADTAPDAWGRRVIARDHAKRRKDDPKLLALTELDYLLAVDDFSRVGALRLRDPDGAWHRTVQAGRRNTPPLIELERVFQASRAVERGQETAEDLRYLQGKGTSLGGMRPKCTLVDEDGRLAIGKFPSVGDTRSVTRGEVLALKLAARAGIDAAPARVVCLGPSGSEVPVAVIQRFDRDEADGRIPYQSAASLLQASREEDRSYTEIADAIRTHGQAPTQDLQQLWRRLVFNLLITNVDDHLQNHGFLHVAHGQWRLAPAFDINPFPDKERESKTWLSERDGPITDVRMLLARASYFALDEQQALVVLGEVHAGVSNWRQVALGAEVGLPAAELDDFELAFEHEQMDAAARLLGR
ncbi:type II toxin-antitoxin system HipA family toxin [Verminephrobacter eiseniae]|uniref:type II toxin-antitoxin system HipA family toxin n=1 Tax=Verminephrobacter eiseniae TaxID=364317 RepID=UPI0010E8D5D5|nr:type II toxin-antitoxin system HipA family toxin [Verminephrobacter eiseniae]KAB7603422.1 type II toxin-antitoxin system HipA family toxin [Verminephrobacter sp. Larva24]MCW5233534.1 type II toxin-antitoxin system HipA family toxin [Verminephrobacter eiseniae]MCW5294911.1 type II toxin-antitoxin system HipA family toxin [Verminephrobacter eiseniae]MCW8183792.1 type II toxin-antitoxin system HipA family toxin [Verminephrobacter eiseniae]MCW8222336.1 type II toxin-antitoxin system HipA family